MELQKSKSLSSHTEEFTTSSSSTVIGTVHCKSSKGKLRQNRKWSSEGQSKKIKEHQNNVLQEKMNKQDEFYTCQKCCKTFNQRKGLQRHKAIHLPEKPFKCKICKNGFAERCALKVHMKSHTGENCSECPVCNKLFVTERLLQRHMITHTDEKPYACSICNNSIKYELSIKASYETTSSTLQTHGYAIG